MIRAYRLYTGPDGNSHVIPGSVNGGKLVDEESIHFKESPPHSTYDWHNDPVPQYVITLAGGWNLPPWAERRLPSILEMSCWQRITRVQATNGAW